MLKPIIICADDYGQNAEISHGIIQLLAAQRLSAVSCLSSLPAWPSYATELLPYINNVDVGLHFNLTLGESTTNAPSLSQQGKFISLKRLLTNAHLRQLDSQAIANELHHQLDQFLAALNRLPDFIDGHEHIHHLPIIRETLINVCQQRFKHKPFYVRTVAEKNLWQCLKGPARFKRAIINLTGACKFKKMVNHVGIMHNSSFSGIYDFSKAADYAQLFPQFLAHIQPGGLIMCHPSLISQDQVDPLYKSRYIEYTYLSSEQFLTDCQQQQVAIVRFQGISKASSILW